MFAFWSSPNHIPIKSRGFDYENVPLKTHLPYIMKEFIDLQSSKY